MHAFTSIIAATFALSFSLVAAAPVNSTETVVQGAVTVFEENGISCTTYPEVRTDGSGRIYVKCSRIPALLQVRGVWKEADQYPPDLNSQSQDATEWFRDNDAHYSEYKSNVKNRLDSTIEWRKNPNPPDVGDCSYTTDSRESCASGKVSTTATLTITCRWIDATVKAAAIWPQMGLTTPWATTGALRQSITALVGSYPVKGGKCPLTQDAPLAENEDMPEDTSATSADPPSIIWDYQV